MRVCVCRCTLVMHLQSPYPVASIQSLDHHPTTLAREQPLQATQMRDIAVLSGSSHPAFAKAICAHLGDIPQGRVKLSKFSNQETNVEILGSVRDLDVYIVQSGCGNVNDAIVEMLIMVAACRTASARKITIVVPFFPYSRQDQSPFKPSGSPSSRIPADELGKIQSFNQDIGSAYSASHTPITANSIASLYLPDAGVPNDTNGKPAPSLDARASIDGQRRPRLSQSISTVTTPTIIGGSLEGLAPEGYCGAGGKVASIVSGGQRGVSKIKTSLVPTPSQFLHHTAPVPGGVGTDFHLMGNGIISSGGDFEFLPSRYRCWNAQCGNLIANMMMAAGADHVITMDLHDPQFQGFFDIPVDNLQSQPLILKYIREKIPNYSKAVIVSPDAGGAKRATVIADKLNIEFALIHKDRRLYNPLTRLEESKISLVGDVKGKPCILIDDLADTSSTITKAAAILKSHGASEIYALITHGILSGDALDRITRSPIDHVIVSNSVPQDEHVAHCEKIKVFDISSLFAEAVRRIHNGESVSILFNNVPY